MSVRGETLHGLPDDRQDNGREVVEDEDCRHQSDGLDNPCLSGFFLRLFGNPRGGLVSELGCPAEIYGQDEEADDDDDVGQVEEDVGEDVEDAVVRAQDEYVGDVFGRESDPDKPCRGVDVEDDAVERRREEHDGG